MPPPSHNIFGSKLLSLGSDEKDDNNFSFEGENDEDWASIFSEYEGESFHGNRIFYLEINKNPFFWWKFGAKLLEKIIALTY